MEANMPSEEATGGITDSQETVGERYLLKLWLCHAYIIHTSIASIGFSVVIEAPSVDVFVLFCFVFNVTRFRRK